MYDDGAGPYTFCKRGRSNCIDQTCNCVDSARYRALYQMAREREGWELPRNRPAATALFFTTCVLIGFVLGIAIAFSIDWLFNMEFVSWVF